MRTPVYMIIEKRNKILMNFSKSDSRHSIIAWFTAASLLAMSTALLFASSETAVSNEQNPKWVKSLPAISCPGSSDTNCHHASPVLADITGDGKQEIIVATNKGHVLAYRHDGSLLWQIDTAPAFGMSGGKQQIASSPAVADLDGDGKMEVVVGAGTMHSSICTQGGVIVLDHLGRVKNGWPFLTQDGSIEPSGCRDSVYSTPALGDLDRDGDLEIVFGSFDKRVYAVHHDGRLVSGFPPDSNHYARFGWDILKGQLADTIWSSPALADMNSDGYLDIVIGSDEGNYDSSWAPKVGEWDCPYQEPLTDGYCGGAIYAFDRHGRVLDGFPRYKHEIIQSVPALMDLNGDGQSEIFIGTGSYYYRVSPDKPSLGFRLYGMDNRGNDLPGWEGGKAVGGVVTASPSLGDITGDGQPNVVVAARDKRLYAWHIDGQPVSGFPMSPRNHFNQVMDKYDIGTNFILADYTGDGKMEIFFHNAWEISIVDGSGQQLTARWPGDSLPAYLGDGAIWNNPAVGDLDGDGRLELVAQNSKLKVWELPNSSTRTDWPMFKKNAARTSLQQPSARIAPQEVVLFTEKTREKSQSLYLTLFSELGSFNWRVSTDQPAKISFPKTSGMVHVQKSVLANVFVPAGLPLGEHHLGNISVTFTRSGGLSQTETIPVKVRVLKKLYRSHLPLVR